MANLDRSTIPDQLLEVHQAIARGNMDHIFDQIPKVDELHFEPMSKETSKILSGKGTLLDHRLFLGEGDNWSAWAYVRCLNQRTEVAIRVVQNKRNIVTYKATSILDMSRFRLMYPFQALNKNNAQNEQRQLKLLIQYYFLEGRFADRIFSNQNNYLVLLSGLRIVEMCYMDLPDPNNISHNLLAPYRPRPKQRPFDRSAGSEEPEPMDSQDTPMTGMPTSRTEEAVPIDENRDGSERTCRGGRRARSPAPFSPFLDCSDDSEDLDALMISMNMNKKRKVDESLMKLDAVQELRREKARDIEHLGNLDQQRLELLEKIKTGEEVIEKELRGIPEEHVRAWFKNLVHDG